MPRGVSPTGQTLTTPETVARMRAVLVARGAEFTYEHPRLPFVAARIPPSLRLVRELTRHPNIDYLEPHLAGEVDTRATGP